MLLRAGHSVPNIGQVLEGNVRTVVRYCFLNDSLRYSVQYVVVPAPLLIPHLIDGSVRRLRAGLLQRSTDAFVLVSAVIEQPAGVERPRARDGDVLHAYIYAENRSVLGLSQLRFRFVAFYRGVKVVLAVVSFVVQRRAFRFPLVATEILPLRAVLVGRVDELRTDPTTVGRERAVARPVAVREVRHRAGVVRRGRGGKRRFAGVLAGLHALDRAPKTVGREVHRADAQIRVQASVLANLFVDERLKACSGCDNVAVLVSLPSTVCEPLDDLSERKHRPFEVVPPVVGDGEFDAGGTFQCHMPHVVS